MSLPPDDIAPAARRHRLMERMRAAGGIAVLATAPEAIRNRDAEYPYRHDSDFSTSPASPSRRPGWC